MKNIVIISVLIMFFTINIYSQEQAEEMVPTANEANKESKDPYSHFSPYKANYLIFGNMDDQVKAQLSFRYETIRKTGIFLGYTQTMFWKLYDKSCPFAEINYNPEIFWNFGDNLNYIQLGVYEHKSNGKGGLESRGWNRSYVQFQVSTGDSFNMGVNVKGFYIWDKADENKDIDGYSGYYEAKIFFRSLKFSIGDLIDKEELYVRGGTGSAHFGFDYKKGWIEVGLKFRVLFKLLKPSLFVQGFYGYGESLIDYNKKDFSLRAGFMLE